MPLISFVIPVYNVAPYVRECLESVIRQEFKDYEVCVVDDGSTDGSSAICDEYAAAYPGLFKLRHQPNQGVSVARNNALDMASRLALLYFRNPPAVRMRHLILRRRIFCRRYSIRI